MTSVKVKCIKRQATFKWIWSEAEMD